MGTMSDIVWAIDPHKDRLADLTQRMRRFASDVLTARGIDFEFQAPDISRKLNLGADVRRQVFLVFKESITQHRAPLCLFSRRCQFSRGARPANSADKGRWPRFDPADESDGHGLVSMQRRGKRDGGTLEVSSRPGEGTSVTLEMPISGGSRLRSSPNGR
jgi:signal transduction histidine kinase